MKVKMKAACSNETKFKEEKEESSPRKSILDVGSRFVVKLF